MSDKAPKSCEVQDCGSPHFAKGWCKHHYHANYAHGDPLAAQGKRERAFGAKPPGATCSVEGCGKPYLAKGYCRKHYNAFRTHGDPTTRLRGEKGQGSLTRGYVSVSIGGRGGTKKLQHRVVMEQILGRPLLPHENVHHINGVRNDNRPENLELWSSSQPPGQRVADKIRWAKEILDLYGDSEERWTKS
jgi:hypothetical protein